MSRRDEEREFESDVYYEVWRGGGNPDRVNPDYCSDQFWQGASVESTARHYLKRPPQEPEPEYPEEPPQEDPIPCTCPEGFHTPGGCDATDP